MIEEDAPQPGSEDSFDLDPIHASPQGIPPAKHRSWVHPSELSIQSPPSVARGRQRVPVLFLAAAAVILLTGVVFLARSSQNHSTGVAMQSTHRMSDLPQSLQEAGSSLVSLRISERGVNQETDGVLIDAEHVVTTAQFSSLASAEITTAHEERVSGTIMGTDQETGITMVLLSLPVQFQKSDSGTAPPGSVQVLHLSAQGEKLSLDWNAATLAQHLRSLQHKSIPVSVMQTSGTPAAPAGSILVDQKGNILGLAAPSFGENVYLPKSFVTDVGRFMETPSNIHGFLRIQGSDAGKGGAQVTAIHSTSPVIGLLATNDVITSLDGRSIASMAELVDVLYGVPAGSTVTLSFRRGEQSHQLTTSLSSSP